MKNSVLKTLKICLTTCFAFLMLGAGALLASPESVEARADGTIASNVYQTDGASVRVFQRKTDEDGNITLKETSKQGIRFHVETGANFEVATGTPLLDVNTKNELNGAYTIAEGYRTYTLVLPTRLLNGGDLTQDTAKVLKIETSGYWHSDTDGNWESVAYIYNIPESMYTDNLSFRGIICDSDDNVLFQTEIAERSLTWVAKQAYLDTIDENDNYWGSAALDNQAAPLIKEFVPTYNITYKVNGKSEEVLWGDTPQNVPTEGVKGAWYDTENSEEVNITETMDWTKDRTLVLETTSSEEFVLTGVAQETDFTDNSGNGYSGFKVFATLHREAFANKTQMDIKAVNVAHMRGGEVVADSFALQGVWTLDEQNSIGEWQMLLFFAIDATNNAKLASGDQIVIKGDSVFYANNVMYKLTEDYTIDYTKTNEAVDYGMYLGDLYNSDVKSLTNCSEDNTGNEGEPNEFTVRVEFYEDVLINGEFTFEFGSDSDTSKYPYPVYIKCGEDETKIIPVSGGRYYWNEGDHKILELIGSGEYANKVFGWHNGDELIAAPGTIVKQNGGYYIFKDQMYGYFLTNGKFDNWGYALGDWVVGDELAEYITSEFATEGTVAETTDYGTLADEIRINTVNHWFGQSKVNLLTTEKMLDSAPYAIYCTSKDGTVTEIDKVRYHGQANPDGGNYQILGLCGEGKFAVGDVVTIAAGTRFWLGTEYYTVTEEITYYYNGNFWVQNYDESTMGTLSSASFGDRAHNQGDGIENAELRMYFTAPVAGYTTNNGGAFDELRIGTGSITFNGEPVSYVRYQRWDEGSTWLSFGGDIGSVAFGDKLIIEEGTTIWGAGSVAYQFTEKVEWIYVANPADTNRTWSRVRGGVTVSATADNATITGSGMFAVGETYTLNVAPTGDYLVSAVIVNNNELPLNASNTYTFTVAQSNTIKVQTVVGHKVFFTVPEGAVVDGGEIANGGFNAVANGGSLTFSVAASEGYKISGVSGATNNGDGTYTVSNVTASTTITISVEKLYKVTYANSTGYTITSTTASGTWVENGTTVTFTVQATSGYIVTAVSGATKSGENTYVATINSADINVTATVAETASIKDITDTIAVENWDGQHDGEDFRYFAIKPSTAAEYMIPSTDLQTQSYWNDHPELIPYNYNVDPMAYILINGVSLRQLVTENASTNKYTGTTFPFDHSGVYAPVTLEMGGADSVGLWMKVMTDFATSYEITVAAGFTFAGANDTYYVSEDVTFVYDDGAMGSKYSTATVTTSNATVSGIKNGDTIEFGQTYNFTVSANSGYQLTSVTINGAEQFTGGSYSFTANGSDVSIVVTAKKLYAVTWSNPTGATISVTANGNAISSGATVVEGTSISVTVTASSGYSVTNVTANGTSIGTTSGTYTVNGATTIAATAKKLYAVTWSNPTGATISVTANGNTINSGATVVEGTSISVTATASSGYRLNTVTIGGANQSGVSTSQAGSSTFNYTVNAATSISATTVKMYQVSWSAGDKTSITCNTSGLENGGWVDNGTTVTFTIKSTNSNYKLTVSGANNTSGDTYSVTVNGANVTVEATATYDASCLVEGTLIMLADGTQKAVENIVAGDKVMVFNHETGKYEAGTIWFNDHADDPARLRNIINLEFANGAKARIAYEHGYFDLDLMQYVFIREDNMHEFIGHRFVSSTYNGTEIVQGETTLVKAYITQEVVRVYGPITEYHFNLISDDMLSMPSFNFEARGMVNIFEYDEDLSYNEEKMQADIAEYGVFTYADFSEYMSYEDYCKAPIQYFKVAIGKGNLTWEQIEWTLQYLAENQF